MRQWYLHDTASNQRLGPMDTEAARNEATRNPGLLAWKEGMGDWLPVRKTTQLSITTTQAGAQFSVATEWIAISIRWTTI